MSLSMLNVCCVLNVCLFFSLFYMGALTKRPLFILFCQQPKRRGECPPNAIIQSTPPQRYTCFPLLKTDNFSSCDTVPFSRLFLSSLLLFPSLFLHFLPVFFIYFSFILRSRYVRSRSHPLPARTFPRDEQRVPTSRIFVPFPIVGSPRDPVPVARISSIKRDVEVRIDEEVSVQNVERLLILYDSGTKRTRARNSKVRFKNVR